MSSILVTGGLASFLVEELESRGHDVYVIDLAHDPMS